MTIEEFTKYYDIEFIQYAYKNILKREPDSSGSQKYLHQLRLGQKTKVQILCSLRFSKEGILHDVYIKNIKKHYIVDRVSNTPLVGSIFLWSLTLIRLPRLLKEINRLKANNDFLTFKLEEVKSSLKQVDSNFNLTAKSIEDIATTIDTKASQDDIRLLYQILSTKLER